MQRIRLAGVTALVMSFAAVTTAFAGTTAGSTVQRLPIVRPHAASDDTTAPAPAHWQRGAPVPPQSRFKIPLVRHGGVAGLAPESASTPDPEVLGFAQVGEVTSGAWTSDLRFDLLSTVAYFGVNVNPDGTLVTNDSGWAGWWSSQLTSLMQAAHGAGDRVVLTVKAFDNPTIASVTGSESARQTLISQIIGQLQSRGGDGVNIDFEGTDASVAGNFTTFVAELYSALQSLVPQQSYLTVDTYAAAGLGGTMYDLSGLTPHLDAFDLMGYGFESSGTTSPSAPLHGDWYNVAQSVSDYMSSYGVPPGKLILGVPYYGYKWSVANPDPGNNGEQPGSSASADTYAGALADFSCAEQLQVFWNSTFDEPYATWYSPATNDPCGGDWNSYRELYYENAQSLGDKYDLVNADGLRGIGIWALGYDSGSNDLWNEIIAKFSVTHGPMASVSPLPQTESATGFTVSWTLQAGSPPVSSYVLWVQSDGGRWLNDATTTARSTTVYGFPGHTYGFYVQGIGTNGYNSGGPAAPQASTTVSSTATWSETAFHTLYAVNGWGSLQTGSSPPIAGDYMPGWDIFRGVALDSSGDGGVTLDGWGGLHTFGDATSATGTFYWPGWDINAGLATTASNQGYVLDGFGGLHPFSINGAAPPPAAHVSAYWNGWYIASALALFPDGSGGVVLDGWGGVHPFTTGQAAAAPAQVTAYWYDWDIARSITLLPGSTTSHYGGYVLDGWGGMHPFGTPGDVPPAVASGGYWYDWDVARGIVLLPGSSSAGYVADIFGGMHPFGGAPAVVSGGYTPGMYLTKGLAIR